MAAEPQVGPQPEWVTMAEAARRLGMSTTSFVRVAKHAGIEVRRRGRQPGVNMGDVEAFLARSRVAPGSRPKRPAPDAHLINEVKARFGWSDRDIAEWLGVTLGTVWWRKENGVPDEWTGPLLRLAAMPPDEVPPARLAAWRARRQGTHVQ